METIIQDVRDGIRSLLKRPSYTAIALVTLALEFRCCWHSLLGLLCSGTPRDESRSASGT